MLEQTTFTIDDNTYITQLTQPTLQALWMYWACTHFTEGGSSDITGVCEPLSAGLGPLVTTV